MVNIRIVVGFALFITALLAGTLFLINFIKTSSFVYLYFLMSLLLLMGLGFILKKEFPEYLKILFLIIPILLIAVTLTLFGSNLKGYYDENKVLDPNSEIANIEATNQYYTDYVTFLNIEILNTRAASLNLQSEMAALIAQMNANQEVVPEEIPIEPPIILYEDDEQEEEEEDD